MTDDIVISTKDTIGSYDGLETAKPGEPVFVCQGGDPFGPPAVLHWASLARAAGVAEQDDKKAAKLLKKASEAELVAWAMMAYQRGEIELEGKRAQYTTDVIQIDSKERAEREAMIRGAASLNNAIAIIFDVAEMLAKYDAHGVERTDLLQTVTNLHAVADIIEPRRENERS